MTMRASTLWYGRMPKSTYVSLAQFCFGVYDAVSNFNIGRMASVVEWHLCFYLKNSPCLQEDTLLKPAKIRIENNYLTPHTYNKENTKKRRKILRGQSKTKADNIEQREGCLYENMFIRCLLKIYFCSFDHNGMFLCRKSKLFCFLCWFSQNDGFLPPVRNNIWSIWSFDFEAMIWTMFEDLFLFINLNDWNLPVKIECKVINAAIMDYNFFSKILLVHIIEHSKK